MSSIFRTNTIPYRHAESTTWLELFFDLVYVAILVELGNRLSHDLTLSGLVEFLFIFIIVWWSWLEKVLFARFFPTDDIPQRWRLRIRQVERVGKVRRHRQDLDLRKVGGDGVRRGDEVFLRNVDRHVGGEIDQVFEENTDLQARAAAELDQAGLRTDQRSHLVRVPRHDRELGFCQVILGQLADLVEQLRAPLIVEILGRDGFLIQAQPFEDLAEFIRDVVILAGQVGKVALRSTH